MTQITGDLALVKKINKSIVLTTIREKSPLSRAHISEITGLNKATVSSLVSELIEEDFIYEIGPGQSSGGRRPVMLLFNKQAGYAVGVDLGVDYLLTTLTDLHGNIVKEQLVHLTDTSFESVYPELKQAVKTMMDSAPSSAYGIVGIGLGVPGIVDDKGVLLFAPNLGWENIDLKSLLMGEFQLPVLVDNEANAGALGEKLYGIGRNVSHLIYVSAGAGIGTGILLNNELYKGSSGFSGEMGHMIIEANGKKCRCGNKGCWELYASINALLSQANQQMAEKGKEQQCTIDLLVKLADEGNPTAINLFAQLGDYLGIGLVNIINTFNPELIIIGNQLSIAANWIVNPLKRMIESRSLPFHRKQLRIEFAGLSIYSCALGAASFAINDFFTNIKVSVE